MIWIICGFVFLLFYFVQSSLIPENILVTLPIGPVQGAAYLTPNNKTYYGFRGIPYALPPIEDLRFEPPQPALPWTETFDATKDGYGCISIHYTPSSDIESEDCLHLNVYVPNIQSEQSLPVMFFIHGGGFQEGNSSKSLYGPDFLMDEENIILVTINYRVGPFGFISSEDEIIPGNMGLKDQNLALKWIYENIEYFGGDPKKITIFGESAGGASVGLHLVSKKSAGLFRSAIVQSGSAVNFWSIIRNSKNLAYGLAHGIPGGSSVNTSEELKSFLKNCNASDIMTSVNGNQITFGPVLEPQSENSFLSDFPYQLLATGNFNRVPIVIGICAEESLLFLKDLQTTKAAAQIADLSPNSVIPTDMLPNSTDKQIVSETIKNIYLKDNQTFLNNLTAYAEYFSDSGFTVGVLKHAELTSNYMPVYLYQFAYYGRPLILPFIEGAEKASHGAEIPFLFNIMGLSGTTDPQDLLVQKQTTTLWSNFAVYLNPSPEISSILNVSWPLFDKQNFTYLNINNTLETGTHLKQGIYSRWNDLYETYGKKPFITF